MKLEKIQGYVGMLKNDHEYKIDINRMATILAILSAYKKGIQNEYLQAQDFDVSTNYIEQNFEKLPAIFHQTVGYILSDIEYCYKEADETLKKFYYFNKER